MKRYICQFHKGGFPELYAVADTHERCIVSEPKPYHDANDEAEARNGGTWTPDPALTPFDFNTMNAWLVGLNMSGDKAQCAGS